MNYWEQKFDPENPRDFEYRYSFNRRGIPTTEQREAYEAECDKHSDFCDNRRAAFYRTKRPYNQDSFGTHALDTAYTRTDEYSTDRAAYAKMMWDTGCFRKAENGPDVSFEEEAHKHYGWEATVWVHMDKVFRPLIEAGFKIRPVHGLGSYAVGRYERDAVAKEDRHWTRATAALIVKNGHVVAAVANWEKQSRGYYCYRGFRTDGYRIVINSIPHTKDNPRRYKSADGAVKFITENAQIREKDEISIDDKRRSYQNLRYAQESAQRRVQHWHKYEFDYNQMEQAFNDGGRDALVEAFLEKKKAIDDLRDKNDIAMQRRKDFFEENEDILSVW